MVAPILRHPSPANRAGQRIARFRRALLALSLLALACGEAAPPESSDPIAAPRERVRVEPPRIPTPLLVGNQLRNPGFEAGAEGWGLGGRRDSLAFEVVSEPVHSGRAAARLVASWRPGRQERPVSVRSALQDISPPRFPDRVEGWFRVDRWESQSERSPLRLQVIVAAIGDPRTRDIVATDGPEDSDVHPELDNFQLRYQLAGPSEDPEDGGNFKHRVVGSGAPELGRWQHFDLPVKADFQRRWGAVPENYRVLRVMFVVRWDDKEAGAALHADVYYDDLFFGFEDL